MMPTFEPLGVPHGVMLVAVYGERIGRYDGVYLFRERNPEGGSSFLHVVGDGEADIPHRFNVERRARAPIWRYVRDRSGTHEALGPMALAALRLLNPDDEENGHPYEAALPIDAIPPWRR